MTRAVSHDTRLAAALALLATLLLAVFAIDRQSLWVDELGTWRLTVAGSFREWLDQFIRQRGTNVQLPLYHATMRAWVTVFPASEWWLRAANLPWLFLAFFALLRAPVPPRDRSLVSAIAAVLFAHPMVWYYANEARPYAMLLAGACLAGSGLLPRLLDERGETAGRTADGFLWVGLALMACASPLGLVWIPAFLVPRVMLRPSRPRDEPGPARVHRILTILCGMAVLAACAWYAESARRGLTWTTAHGHRLESFVFGVYEIAGVAGMGPGRDELRRSGAAALGPYAIPIGIFVTGMAMVVCAGIVQLARRDPRRTMIALVGALAPVAILFALAGSLHWRVVGRHLMPLVWWFACLVAFAIVRSPGRPARSAIAVRPLWATVALGLLAVSSVQIAVAPRHEREDYRGASALALGHWDRGEVVWWVAAPFGASYYGIDRRRDMADPGAAQRLVIVANPDAEELVRRPSPDVVVLTRPDAYDPDDAVSRYVTDRGYRLERDRPRGFDVWSRTGQRP